MRALEMIKNDPGLTGLKLIQAPLFDVEIRGVPALKFMGDMVWKWDYTDTHTQAIRPSTMVKASIILLNWLLLNLQNLGIKSLASLKDTGKDDNHRNVNGSCGQDLKKLSYLEIYYCFPRAAALQLPSRVAIMTLFSLSTCKTSQNGEDSPHFDNKLLENFIGVGKFSEFYLCSGYCQMRCSKRLIILAPDKITVWVSIV